MAKNRAPKLRAIINPAMTSNIPTAMASICGVDISRHRLQLRDVGNNKGRNDGGNKISGGLNAKQFGRPRIDERHGEQNSSQSNQRWHGCLSPGCENLSSR